MDDYIVVWEINIDADSPEEAAQIALEIQRDRASDATCFTVRKNCQDRANADCTHDHDTCDAGPDHIVDLSK